MEKEPRSDQEPEFTSISEIAGRLGMQSQYVSHYLGGYGGKPNLAEGIRYHGHPYNYHEISIHPDDVDEFIRRIAQYREGGK